MLDWLYSIVAQLIVWIHTGLSAIGIDKDSGWAWGGSIILLVVLLRLLMVPLFVKQIHASRKMQELNPQIQSLRKKYKNDKQRLNQEVMKLYQENGANPLSGCLPILVQFPVFIGLFQVLKRISDAKPNASGQYPDVFAVTGDLVASAQKASIFGAHIPDTFIKAWGLDPRPISALVVTGIAVIISSCTTFFTVRASMRRQPITDENNPMMQAQKMMVVLAPVFGLFGLGFPLGVLLYWVTSNTWTLVQQHYIYSKYPPATADGNGATATTGAKTGAKAGAKGGKQDAATTSLKKGKARKDAEPDPEPESDKPKVVRNQPTRKPRSKRSGSQKR
ncbi:hypothetical protein GCM10009678_05480 [Actinomadura kijaniata]|uniref:Membrane protein insertase YidC n=1 Tax=Actinomadura namibiensis TaxID=182080 RepID=A0A7W3QKK2_ACTNM|nr:membrane protein insertase YidC [Actinomadura namibiensis]MBA8950486.1 YidC/Oxa1 family membrane protein insertase [Actinomadura namibiensis]